MVVILKQLKISNFKGLESKEINFSPTVTNIFGANRAGKTTIFDAFNFLLFNKNSEGDESFAKKPLDTDGNIKGKQVNNTVEGEFLINDKEISMAHSQEEEWSNTDGEETFKGNRNKYEFNSVPVKPTEYKAKINDIMDEETFKMITNPLYFDSLPTDVKRKHIEAICGTLTDMEIAESKKEFKDLVQVLNKITLKDLKTKLKSQISTIKKEINNIPSRIEEATRDIPEEINVKELATKIKSLQDDYNKLDEQINNINLAYDEKNNTIKKIRDDIHQLELKNQTIKNTHSLEYTKIVQNMSAESDRLTTELSSVNADLLTKEKVLGTLVGSQPASIKLYQQEINDAETQVTDLYTLFEQVNGKSFNPDDNDFSCSLCSRPFDEDKISEMRDDLLLKFNQNKAKQIDDIQAKGKALRELQDSNKKKITAAVENHQADIDKAKEAVEVLQNKKTEIEAAILQLPDEASDVSSINTVDQRVEKDAEYTKNSKAIEQLKTKLEESSNEKPVEFQEIIKKKALINADIDQLKRLELTQETRAKKLARKDELVKEGETFGKKKAELDRQLHLVGKFERTKANLIEDKVAEHFNHVRFRFFEFTQEGEIVPTCDTLLNGVPFKDLNTEGKYAAGLDIIMTLTKHYGVKAPIWIDNRESITELIDTGDLQIINLIVSPEDKKLRIEHS